MSYESAFAQGERDAYQDRRLGLLTGYTPMVGDRTPVDPVESAGYLAGYTPRSATWGAAQSTPVGEWVPA